MTKVHPSRGGRKAPFTADDVTTLRRMLDQETGRTALRDKAMAELMFSTGLRVGDVLALTVQTVTDAAGSVTERVVIRQGKTDRQITVGLSPRARVALAAWIAAEGLTGADPLFPRLDRAAQGLEAMTSKTVRQIIKRWAGLIGRDTRRFSAHSTRRSVAVHLYETSGHNVEKVRRALGHAGLAATHAYLGVGDDDAIDDLMSNPL